uniref:Uncharacterized protein n=1 Tax=Chromera velia CCMP2878 TaxID=1169474 RepID=A0A0G4G5J5_9ALVE|eukprot:Cvel_20352.t1-p1 / transcript=Cvel_20352.t1 / gene=Cvel_20352 / organism=Chromera_velia_CCMP2878 / gene_product=hypothetical protein / transcript_product=hypothetical protein / location=Cvel_scaffold1820:7474-8828(-) / protein_length=265 / sequence_SO=supercontig / SO=protein_coding / is_pseudo=false
MSCADVAQKPGGDLPEYVEVSDEPSHHTIFKNEYCIAIRVQFEKGHSTLFHRHSQDSLFVFLANISIHNNPTHRPAWDDSIQYGGAVFARHGVKPIIHQITALTGDMHCLDIEILKPPPEDCKPAGPLTPEQAPGHVLEINKDRMRTYRVKAEKGGHVAATYGFCGLVIFLKGAKVKLWSSRSDGLVGEALDKCLKRKDTENGKEEGSEAQKGICLNAGEGVPLKILGGDILWLQGPQSIRITDMSEGGETGEGGLEILIAEWCC